MDKLEGGRTTAASSASNESSGGKSSGTLAWRQMLPTSLSYMATISSIVKKSQGSPKVTWALAVPLPFRWWDLGSFSVIPQWSKWNLNCKMASMSTPLTPIKHGRPAPTGLTPQQRRKSCWQTPLRSSSESTYGQTLAYDEDRMETQQQQQHAWRSVCQFSRLVMQMRKWEHWWSFCCSTCVIISGYLHPRSSRYGHLQPRLYIKDAETSIRDQVRLLFFPA